VWDSFLQAIETIPDFDIGIGDFVVLCLIFSLNPVVLRFEMNLDLLTGEVVLNI